MVLNSNGFRLVFDDNFASDTSLNKTLWSDNWGYSSQYSFSGGALTLTSIASQYYYPVGFKQATPNAAAGEGYGLYQFSGYGNPGQGKGICFIMWRADNAWLDASHPGTATELDILESWDGSRTGESTLHWYDQAAKSNNGYQAHLLAFDPTKLHTYSMDWERGSLTYYVDGQQIYQDTTHAPLDYADGGCNEVMGAQVIYATSTSSTSTVALHITDMRYSAPLPTITLTPPGTFVEASVGAGVTVTETAVTTHLSGSIEAEVLTASGAVESTFRAVPLGSNGTTSFSVHLAKSGDIIKVVDNIASPAVTAVSAAVIITDPAPVAKFAAVLPSPLYTGLQTVIGTGGVAGLELERITQGTYNAPGLSGWIAATVAANGTWTVQLTFNKPGMLAHVFAENGGSKTVVDLINGTPSNPPSLKVMSAGMRSSVMSDMVGGASGATAIHAMRLPEPARIGGASALLGETGARAGLLISTDHGVPAYA